MVSRISGTDAFTATTPGVASASTSPSPPLSETSYFYANTASQTDYQRWSGLTAADAWQWRRLIYVTDPGGNLPADLDLIALRGGSDATNKLVVRLQATNKLRVVDSTGAFVFTSSTNFTFNTWYRLEGYGNAGTGIGRVALFPTGSTTAVSGFDTGEIAMTMGGTGGGPTGVRLGRTSSGGTYALKSCWCRDELYTGTDAAFGFKGLYTGNTPPTASPAFSTVQATKLVANVSDSDGTITSIAWSITSSPGGSTYTLLNSTSSTAYLIYDTAGNYGIRCAVTDNSSATTNVDNVYNAPAPGTVAGSNRKVYKASTSSWVTL